MKPFIFGLFICLLAGFPLYAQRNVFLANSHPVTWTEINDTENASCPLAASQCTVTVPATVAGDIGVLEMLSIGNHTLTTTTGEVLTHCSNCAQWDATVGAGLDESYLASLAGGVTNIVANINSNEGTFWLIRFVEFRKSGGGAAFDNSTSSDVAACTSCNSPTLAVFNSGELIVQEVVFQNDSTGLPYPYVQVTPGEVASWALGWNGRSAVFPQNMSGKGLFGTLAFK